MPDRQLRAAFLSLAILAATQVLAIPAVTQLSPASAQALPPSSPCLNDPGFACSSVVVPLDRSGAAPGTIALSVERRGQGASPSEDAVVALAGGPGQAAIPLAGAAAQMMAPGLSSRDLIVFDQRGTGTSGPLGCRVLEGPLAQPAAIGAVFERCAQQIGPARGAYTSEETVADIEAIRQAFGYRRLVLFGVSYGTKVALQYAERHPGEVEALILDSVVPTGDADPFSTAMFKAIAPMLGELCAARACDAITRNPAGDLAGLATRLHGHSLHGAIFDGAGRRHRDSMSEADLLNLVGAGDLNPALRALLPAAVQSALHGDPNPLLRLNLLSEGLIPNVPAPPLASGEVDEALFVDTTCEEELFPWRRSAPPDTRVSEALAALRALSPSEFLPFDAGVAWSDGVLPGCAHWPNVAPPPPPAGPLPAVPTLLLSGMQDIRTPTPNAQSIAARIPGAQLLTVPYTGHSVLGSDFSGCAQAAVKAFFATQPIQPCQAGANPFAPTPITPTHLGAVRPVGGVPGRPGRTLAVALDTILDLERQVIGATLQAEQRLPSGSSFGGLRGGYARLTSSSLVLHRLAFVDGVALSGRFPISKGHLLRATIRVEGRDAARGTIRIAGNPHVDGTLGGHRFDVNLAKVRLAARGGEASARAGATTGFPGELSLAPSFPAPTLARLR